MAKKPVFLSTIFCGILLISCTSNALPKPEVGEGYLAEMFGIDKNINEATIDNYLHRSDVVYRDMRMLVDPGDYASIGGDAYLSGFISGFEVVPYPYLVPVSGLPESVGPGYQGPTLFSYDVESGYTPNYKESMAIIEYLFPQNKAIFLMCGGAGYAGMTKQFLLDLGWDANLVYNIGGYWYYAGNYNVTVKRIDAAEQVHYDFWKVAYHEIDFATLTAI